MKSLLLILLCSISLVATSFAAEPKFKETDKSLPPLGDKWSFEAATNPNPALPRVLLIGDSICIGYKGMVIKALAEQANVDVWTHPMFQSEKLNLAITKILKNGPYDVVHVNLGLHGVTEGRIKTGTYEPLTRQFIQIIRDAMPKVKIIWANTTQFTLRGKPTELDPVTNANILAQNRMAANVMAAMKIPVNDFYGLLIDKLELGRGDTVHWTPPASQILADRAVASILAALAPSTAAGGKSQPDFSKPNIVFILADDLGYGDVSCYGATKLKTPNIDRLARQGMKFTDAHTAASVCSPSRYGLMTGRSPWRLHKTGNGYRLETGRMTMASLLKTHGYRAAAIGKWHLGYSKDWNKLPITGPLEVGFDYHFGVPQNHNDSTRCYIENHDIVGRKPGEEFRIVKGKDFPEGLAQPRVDDQVGATLTAKAVGFIRENAARPFFLYFTPCIPHTHVTPAAEFRGTSEAGLLGDALQELDAQVGTILRTLDELQLADNTLIVFTSDNGGTPKDFKGTQDAKLLLASEAGGIRAKFMNAKGDAKALGHVTNGPWHDGKGSPYEGGHRVPFIARWPGRIAPSASSDYTFCLTDMLATAADILAVKLPDNAGEDSHSLLPALLGKPPAMPLRQAIFVQGDTDDNAIAICTGRWKLIASTNSKKEPVHQLYDLNKDPGETTDIAKAHPEIVHELAAALAKARTDGRTRF